MTMRAVFNILCVLIILFMFDGGAIASDVTSKDPKVLMCYYSTWAAYRNGNGEFTVDNIDPHLCTHVIYAFIGLNKTGKVNVLDPWLDLPEGLDTMRKLNQLKEVNTKLKTLVAIGGWGEDPAIYSKVMNDPILRATFVEDITEFIVEYGFSGLDLDWEYPGQRGGIPSDKEAFVQVLKELRKAFDPLGLIITAAVAAIEFSAKISYDIPQISKYLDIINIMEYDIGGPWDPLTAHNAPMYASSRDTTQSQRTFNLNASIHYWLSQGAPKEKIAMGIPLFGHTFLLADTSKISPGSLSHGYGEGGQYSYENGYIGYNEFCEQQVQGKPWKRYWDSEQLVPYAVKGKQWLSYDDPESIKIKADFIRDMGLGGAMVWSIENDDFRGLCNGGVTYPLLRQIWKSLDGIPDPTEIPPVSTSSSTSISTSSSSASSSSSSSVTVPPTAGTTPPPTGDFECTGLGTFRDPKDCGAFYMCISLGADKGYEAKRFLCPDGLHFDPNLVLCNWPALVMCKI